MPDPRPGTWPILRSLWPFLAPYRARMLLAGIALLVAAGATLAVPLAMRHLVDLGFAPGKLAEESAKLNGYFIGLFLLSTLLAVATALRFYSVSWLGERVAADLRQRVYAHVLTQDPKFFETLQAGEVLSRLSSDTTVIQTLVGTSVSLGLRNLVLFIGSLTLMAVTSPRLAAIIGMLIVLLLLPVRLLGRRVRTMSRSSQDRIAEANAMAGERLSAIQTVQAFARESHESERFRRATDDAFDTALRRIRARAWLTATAIVLVFGAILFVLWLGAHAVIDGSMSLGELTQFILYSALVAGATGALSEVVSDAQRAVGAAERLLELLALEPAIVSRQDLVTPPAAASRLAEGKAPGQRANAGGDARGAALDVESVSFHYPSRPNTRAIDDLTLHVEPGETVAIVGPSGAGKTTLFQLVLRFYDPQSGRLRLDGRDLRDWDPARLRGHIGVVAQDNSVFSVDAMENIRYGRLDASDGEVMRAAAAAHAAEFIEELPQGYRTQLGERGVRLSGGQRQRVAIARALLKDPPLLLLDEATSALDAESERLVQEALGNAMRGRTTLVIAHRLATVVNAGRIVVLEHGRLVEQGTHAELTARGGLYARLAALQFQTPDG